MMSIRRWARLLLCASMLLLGSQAMAQKMLMLTTDAGGVNSSVEESEFTNMRTEFSNVVGAANVTRVSTLFTANGISAATFNPPGGPYDMVVVASHYRAIHPTNWAVLSQAVANRWANSVLLFVDGYDDTLTNDVQMLELLNANTGRNFTLGTKVGVFQSYPLNANSAYSGSFTSLDPVYGGFFDYINNVPGENVLYLANGTPVAGFPPAGSTALVNGVYALLVPVAQSNNGQGACVFATVDVSSFRDTDMTPTRNGGKIAQAFVRAVTDPGGACGLPTVTKRFDKTDVLLGGAGNTAQLTIEFQNDTLQDVAHAKVTDALPSPLLIGSGPVTHTCTGGTLTATEGSSTVNLDDFGIPHTTGCSITVPVVWPNDAAGRSACADPVARTVTNIIRPGVDFTPASSGNNATATLTCQPGTLAVGKTVAWAAGSQATDLTGSSFPVSVSCTGTDGVVVPSIATSVTLSTPTAGAVSVTPVISSGSCTVTETSRPAAPANHQWVEVSPPSGTVALLAPPGSPAVALTNTLARSAASIALTKTVAGGPAAGVTGNFDFTASCGVDGNYTGAVALSNASSGTGGIAGVPQGASCVVTENTPLPTAPVNYSWGVMPAAVPVTVVASGNAAAFTNTLVRSTAAISLTKNVTGAPAGGVSGSFAFTASCGASGSFTGTVVLANATTGTGTITNVPQGVSCSVSESTTLPSAPAGLAWGRMPAAVTLTVAATGNAAAFTNELTAAAGNVAAIPTLSQWALMMLALMLAGMAALSIRAASRD